MRGPVTAIGRWVLATTLCPAAPAWAQGVTTGSIAGTVVDSEDRSAPGATIVAVHEPSGSRYEGTSGHDGRFAIPGLRVGGPYAVTVTLGGLPPGARSGVFVVLGASTDLPLRLGSVAIAEELTVVASAADVLSAARTGAATTIGRQALEWLPTINDRLNDFARLAPQYAGGASGAFAGTDNRLNNITVDGASFNSSFGLVGQPGDVTGVAPIATEVLEEIQVSVAPYDVRQGHFVGAAVNAVTRSGGNRFQGSAYHRIRDQALVGREARGARVDPGAFEFERWGAWASGPLRRDRLSFFLGLEDETLTSPGTPFRARREGETVQGNTTRVRASDLDRLGDFLRSRFGYDPGPYEGYDHQTPATRYLAKLDASLGHRHKLGLRFVRLDSSADALVSNAGALGFPNRRLAGLNFQNSNFQVFENIRSVVGEWLWLDGGNRSNRMVVGYTGNDESRAVRGALFPTVDILEQGAVYTTFGSEPFTPGNERRYHTFQLQDDFTWRRRSHMLGVGASLERFESENVFFPGSQGVYVYDSLADFFADAGDHLAHPERTVSPVTLRRFQLRWSNIPGREEPVQRLGTWYAGFYAQDEWQAGAGLKLTLGLRADVPFFDDTAIRNPEADALTFRDRDGSAVRFRTGELPATNVLWSPRAGFNWADGTGRRTQIRGGTGLFTGRPAYVWISSHVGGTGVLTGFEDRANTRDRPFDPNVAAYRPADVTGAPASRYELTLTDPALRFPQVWRSDLAMDRRLPWGIIATLEALYTRDVHGVQFFNANLPAPQARFAGPDGRPRWTVSQIQPNVTTAIVLGNQDEGRAWHLAASLAKAYRGGFVRAAWAAGDSRTPAEPGGTALSWAGNPHSGDPNNPGAGYFVRSRRVFAAGSHRFAYGKLGATTVSFFFEGRNDGRASYTYAGDLNGDGGAGNDLVYVPRDTSEMNFQPFTSGGRTFTAAEQAAAWNAYIAQDRYLRGRRGRYAERNGIVMPMVWRLDLSVAQEVFRAVGGRRHALQLRADLLNATNLLNDRWGVSQTLLHPQPLVVPPAAQGGAVDAQGRATYRLRVVDNELISRSYGPSATVLDVYRVQLGARYSFN